ncbi:nitrilase-related carbon-nitrogen hydrolase, partial [Kaarinaea lacus]
MDNKLTLALVQHKCTENKDANLEKSMASIRDAAAKGARLVLLQELHSTLYFCQEESARNFDLAETIPGPTTDTLSILAKELDIVIVASVF